MITGFTVFSRIFKVNNNNFQGYIFKDFQGQQQQFSRIYFKARPPLPPLLEVRSTYKIIYCHMILTYYKLITTMLVNTSNNTFFAESAIAVKLDDGDAEVGQ